MDPFSTEWPVHYINDKTGSADFCFAVGSPLPSTVYPTVGNSLLLATSDKKYLLHSARPYGYYGLENLYFHMKLHCNRQVNIEVHLSKCENYHNRQAMVTTLAHLCSIPIAVVDATFNHCMRSIGQPKPHFPTQYSTSLTTGRVCLHLALDLPRHVSATRQ